MTPAEQLTNYRMPDDSIQHKAAHVGSLSFENGEPVGTVEFQYPNDEQEVPKDSQVMALLDIICPDNTPETIGRWLLLLWHRAGRGPWKSDAELARFLNFSKSRLSQISSEIPNEFSSLMRCNRRSS